MSKIVAYGKNDETDCEIKRISAEFENLWMMDNHRVGMEIFLNLLKGHMQEEIV